jgi:tetratricopeptide (TPR) repeat protein
VLIDSRRYDEALVQLQKTLELEPSFPTTHLSFSTLYQLTGKQAGSVESYANYLQLSGRTEAAKLARDAFARGGWQNYLNSMSGPSRPAGISSFMAANFYAQLGKIDEAFAELNKSLDNREFQLLYLKVDPRLDSLRNDPRYEELVQRMRFPAN